MEQLILHLLGDYVLQSDWMATEKRRNAWAAMAHATVYALPFLLLRPSLAAFYWIWLTHFLIDRFGLARYVVWAKNHLAPRRQSWEFIHHNRRTPAWEDCRATGYPPDRPAWLAVWLLIAADNTLHLAINYAALRWL